MGRHTEIDAPCLGRTGQQSLAGFQGCRDHALHPIRLLAYGGAILGGHLAQAPQDQGDLSVLAPQVGHPDLFQGRSILSSLDGLQ